MTDRHPDYWLATTLRRHEGRIIVIARAVSWFVGGGTGAIVYFLMHRSGLGILLAIIAALAAPILLIELPMTKLDKTIKTDWDSN